jgi:quercetin dioxygenase-like cupin family protein
MLGILTGRFGHRGNLPSGATAERRSAFGYASEQKRGSIYGNEHTRRDKDGAVSDSLLVEGKDSGGSVAIFELDVPAGAKVPIAHSHDAYEETIYGIDGVLTFTLEGRTIEVGPRDALCIPRGAVHRFDNLHSANSRTLAIATPGILTRTTSAKSPPSPKPRPAAHPILAEVMRRHGLTPAP